MAEHVQSKKEVASRIAHLLNPHFSASLNNNQGFGFPMAGSDLTESYNRAIQRWFSSGDPAELEGVLRIAAATGAISEKDMDTLIDAVHQAQS